MSRGPSSGDEPTLILASGSLGRLRFEDRVAAAAAAGFEAIGLSAGEYGRMLADGHDATSMRSVLHQHGLQLTELEVLVGFAARAVTPPVLSQPRRHPASLFWEMAEVFGARHLQVVGSFGTDVLEDDAAEAFAGLCDAAAERGMLVALEFVPVTNVPDIGVAGRIVAAADRPNGGLCVDSWHHFRGACDWELLAAVDPSRVAVIQLDDGPSAPVQSSFLADTKRHREPPGQGEFDLIRFLQTLWDAGVRAPVSVEVLSDRLKNEPADRTAQILAETSRSVLARAANPRPRD